MTPRRNRARRTRRRYIKAATAIAEMSSSAIAPSAVFENVQSTSRSLRSMFVTLPFTQEVDGNQRPEVGDRRAAGAARGIGAPASDGARGSGGTKSLGRRRDDLGFQPAVISSDPAGIRHRARRVR
jgi:hypothetical protein